MGASHVDNESFSVEYFYFDYPDQAVHFGERFCCYQNNFELEWEKRDILGEPILDLKY